MKLEHARYVKECKQYKKRSTGSDHWLAQEICQIPLVASGAIVDALNTALADFCIPHQLLLNLNALLGKPSLHDDINARTISKTPMLYRILCRCDDKVADWSAQQKMKHDTSSEGRSALAAALYRAVRAEIESEIDNTVGACV